MKENAIKFLYAIDCYLLYLLSGVVSAAGVVAYYSIRAALDYGNIGDVPDAGVFVDYIADFVSGKSSVVLLVSYVIVLAVLLLVFAIRRRSLAAYAGMSHARLFSIIGSLVLGVILNLIIYTITPENSSAEAEINAVLIMCVILGPFVEELMFRGVLLKMFGSACGIVGASVITSALFAISHTDPVQIVYAFIIGIVMCMVRVKSTSLWSTVALHLSFNIAGAMAMLIKPCLSQQDLMAAFAIGVVCFVIACSGGRKTAPKKVSKCSN